MIELIDDTIRKLISIGKFELDDLIENLSCFESVYHQDHSLRTTPWFEESSGNNNTIKIIIVEHCATKFIDGCFVFPRVESHLKTNGTQNTKIKFSYTNDWDDNDYIHLIDVINLLKEESHPSLLELQQLILRFI